MILAKAEELSISSPKGLDKVTTNTRDPKLNVEDRLSLRDSWRDRAAALGFDGKALLAQAIGRSERGGSETGLRTERGVNEVLTGIRDAVGSIFSPRDPLVDRGLDRLGLTASEYRAQHAVASAVRILEQREAAFSVPEVTRTALDLGLAGVTAEKVDARISALVREEKLIPGKSDRIDGIVTHVTTPDALATESKILAEIDAGKGAAKPIVAPDQVVMRLTEASGDKTLNAGQMAAATLALSSSDRIVAVQGVAGAGKSTMIASVARVAEAEGRKVLGLAFQNKMVGDLREGSGIEAQTVSSFVNTYALNMHMAQGITADKGIAVMSSTESNLSNQRLFNVTVTRVRDDLTLYTDNKDRLTSAIERNEGNKTSALETVGQLEVDKAPQRQTSPSGQATPFNPTLPPDHDRKSMDLTHLRVAVEPRTPDLPFPEKDIGLEL